MIGAIRSRQLSAQRFETAASSYERYSSALICLIVLVGWGVIMMFLFWLNSVDWRTNKEPAIASNLKADGKPEGIAEDFEEPGVTELADVPEPQLMYLVKAMANDRSTLEAAYQAIDGRKEKLGPGYLRGDHRTVGVGNEGPPHLSDADRWEVRYTTTSREEYARQLDFFKIELGAISPVTEHIAYATNLLATPPTGGTGDRTTERAKNRIYFRYPQSGSKLKDWDLEMLKRAGVNTSGRILVQFYPNETRQMLLALERQELGDKTLESVLKTTFGVRATKIGFEYYVMDIKYRS